MQYLDAAESAFFARELEYVKSKTYDIKYPGLKSSLYIPVSTEVPSGSVEVTYQQFDRYGKAKIIAPGATDSPRVDVAGQEFSRPVRIPSASYGWHLIELRQAMLAGRPLNARKAAACRRAIEEVLDEVAAVGAPSYGIATGFLNNASVAIDAATGNWSGLTADQIIADVGRMWGLMKTDTLGIESANILLLPDAQHTLIATTPRSTTSDTTILEFLLKSFVGLEAIEPWYRLDGAGAGAVDRAVLYRRSADHVQQDVPNPFEQLPMFQKGMNFEVECFAETAGTVFYYPRSCRYMDGI